MTTRFVTSTEALSMVKTRNHPVLKAGHMLTVKPGVTLRRVKSGAVLRYQLTEARS